MAQGGPGDGTGRGRCKSLTCCVFVPPALATAAAAAAPQMNRGEVDEAELEARRARGMADPEVQGILTDPVMRQVGRGRFFGVGWVQSCVHTTCLWM